MQDCRVGVTAKIGRGVVFAMAIGSLLLGTLYAEVIDLEGTVKAVDVDARTVTIERRTPSGTKTLTLEVAKKAGDVSDLKPGSPLSFSYDPDLEIVTRIGSVQKSREEPSSSDVADAAEVVEQTLNKVRQNQDVCDEANRKLVEGAVAQLRAAATAMEGDGRQQDARRVLKNIDILRTTALQGADNTTNRAARSDASLLERLAGDWSHRNLGLTYHCMADGTFKETSKGNGSVNAHGRIEVRPDDSADISLSNGFRLRLFAISHEHLGVLVATQQGLPFGDGMVLTRVKRN